MSPLFQIINLRYNFLTKVNPPTKLRPMNDVPFMLLGGNPLMCSCELAQLVRLVLGNERASCILTPTENKVSIDPKLLY